MVGRTTWSAADAPVGLFGGWMRLTLLSKTGSGETRADQVYRRLNKPLSSLPPGRGKGAKILEYFDTTRFANPGPGMIGTLDRNVMRGPGPANVDTSLVRGVRLRFLGEAGQLQLRSRYSTCLTEPISAIRSPD
jgi:hypothetical protein